MPFKIEKGKKGNSFWFFFSPKERQFYLPIIRSLIIIENSVPQYDANLHNVCYTGYTMTKKTHTFQ